MRETNKCKYISYMKLKYTLTLTSVLQVIHEMEGISNTDKGQEITPEQGASSASPSPITTQPTVKTALERRVAAHRERLGFSPESPTAHVNQLTIHSPDVPTGMQTHTQQ
jgi:hypothetical protein